MTPQELRKFASVMHNLDRDTLEHAGLMNRGQVGGGDWKRFNDEPMMFVLKLPPDKLVALAKIITDEMAG